MEAPTESAVGVARRLVEGFGLAVKSARAHYHVTLRALAEQVDMRADELTRIEHARFIPTPEQELRLHRWLLQHPVPIEEVPE